MLCYTMLYYTMRCYAVVFMRLTCYFCNFVPLQIPQNSTNNPQTIRKTYVKIQQHSAKFRKKYAKSRKILKKSANIRKIPQFSAQTPKFPRISAKIPQNSNFSKMFAEVGNCRGRRHMVTSTHSESWRWRWYGRRGVRPHALWHSKMQCAIWSCVGTEHASRSSVFHKAKT